MLEFCFECVLHAIHLHHDIRIGDPIVELRIEDFKFKRMSDHETTRSPGKKKEHLYMLL